MTGLAAAHIKSRGAEFSPCGTYRHFLWRRWDSGPPLVFVMLNPSTATAEKDDPTIARCGRWARNLGFGGIRVVNIFQYRSTDPGALRVAADPVGPEANRWLARAWDGAGMVIAAWGAHGSLKGIERSRCCEVVEGAREAGIALWALAETAAGQPRHPLYLSYELTPHVWARDGLVLSGKHVHALTRRLTAPQ